MTSFTNLPNDLVNEIISKCGLNNTHLGVKSYIKMRYYSNKVVYFEYKGDMSDGNPNGYGKMNSITKDKLSLDIPNDSYLETDWLYVPFLMVSKEFTPNLKMN